MRSFLTLFTLLLFSAAYSASANATCKYSKTLQIEASEAGNHLTWTTMNEVNGNYFLVEKSTDGINYSVLTRLKTLGENKENQDYKYLDTESSPVSYYRLIFVNLMGNSSPSHVAYHNVNAPKSFKISAFNTPSVEKKFVCLFDASKSGEMQLEVKNQVGDILKSQIIQANENINVLQISLKDYAIGAYTIALTMEGETEQISVRKIDTSTFTEEEMTSKKE